MAAAAARTPSSKPGKSSSVDVEACEAVASALEGVKGTVSASVLAADAADLSREVSRVLDAGADWIHVDVVDNHFAKVTDELMKQFET